MDINRIRYETVVELCYLSNKGGQMELLKNPISIYMKSAIDGVENNVGATTTTALMTERHHAATEI